MREQNQASTMGLEETTEWLLKAAEIPDRARAEWALRNVALMRCGRIFASIRVRADIVHAAAGTSESDCVTCYLERALLGGPVFTDRTAAWFYCLVHPNACREWDQTNGEALCMVDDHYLGVPRLDQVSAEQGRSYWCVRPSGPGQVGSVGAVSQMVSVGVLRLTP
ncbi:hypothetical protein ACIRU8_14400 [Streptomyces sp. NPDC101175]|uniref:hypothetical protein n=1 Tax=Streptomyces sp. NPDC101175 TaxID=3366123 RepID=UPI0038347900